MDRITATLTCSLLVVMVLVACWQVFTRFLLNTPSTVSEEFLRYSLIWLTMLGAAYTYGKRKHIAIVFVVRKFPKKVSVIVDLIVEIIVLMFILVILLFGGYKAFENAQGQVSSALGLPIEYLYMSLIVAGILFLFYALIHIVEHINRYRNKSLDEDIYKSEEIIDER
ncbi:TRAP transporter small permease [Planomicrobium sp. CPCC 101079]|uniref:TRAP transporter small permease n=1 Tax=Planomicrobium sp. CPCC 101079 TaxID=2599618 RepID=UPI002103167D|nr:TRAP transporter small permease [Planomicrobium sp. CPCC 101079]